MGGAVVKAWDAHATHAADVGDCVDAIRGGLTDKDNIIQRVTKIERFVKTRLSPAARAAHVRAVIRYKGVETLQSVIDEHPREELVLRPVCQLLVALSRDEDCAEIMRKIELRAQLLEIVRNNGDDNFVLNDVRAIFMNMKASLIRLARVYINRALDEKDLAPIQTALKNQPRELIVHQFGLEALAKLVREKEVALQLLEANGTLKQIMLSVARFRTDAKIQHAGFLAVTYIAKADVRLATLLGRVGAISVIAHNLRHLDEISVDRDSLQQAIWALNELGKIRKNKARLESERIGLVLRLCMDAFTRREDARAKARELQQEQRETALRACEQERAPEGGGNQLEGPGPDFADEKEIKDGPARPIVIPLKLKRLMTPSQEKGEDPQSIALASPDPEDDATRPTHPALHQNAQDSGEPESGMSESGNDSEDGDDEEKFVIREFDNTDSVVALDKLIREVAVDIDGFGPDPNAPMSEAQIKAAPFKSW